MIPTHRMQNVTKYDNSLHEIIPMRDSVQIENERDYLNRGSSISSI